MAHDDLTVRDVLDLIHEHPTAASQIQKLTDVELSFVVYDAFSVHGYYDDYGRGNWGFGVALGGDAVLSSLFGRRLSICGTRDEVRAALDAIDSYARLRLGPEYLAAYEAANGS